jgi:hypothetical protein
MRKESIHLIKGYLGYEVEVLVKFVDEDTIHTVLLDTEIAEICKCCNFGMDYLIIAEYEYHKLKLRPIEDLNFEDDWNLIEWLAEYEFMQILSLDQVKATLRENPYRLKYETYEKLYSEHIDIFDLIGKNLAVKKGKE